MKLCLVFCLVCQVAGEISSLGYSSTAREELKLDWDTMRKVRLYHERRMVEEPIDPDYRRKCQTLDRENDHDALIALQEDFLRRATKTRARVLQEILDLVGRQHEMRFRQLLLQQSLKFRDWISAADLLGTEIDLKRGKQLQKQWNDAKPEWQARFGEMLWKLRCDQLRSIVDAERVAGKRYEGKWPKWRTATDEFGIPGEPSKWGAGAEVLPAKLLNHLKVQQELGLTVVQLQECREVLKEAHAAIGPLDTVKHQIEAIVNDPELQDDQRTDLLNQYQAEHDKLVNLICKRFGNRFREILFQYYVDQDRFVDAAKATGKQLTAKQVKELTERQRAMPMQVQAVREVLTLSAAASVLEGVVDTDIAKAVGKIVLPRGLFGEKVPDQFLASLGNDLGLVAKKPKNPRRK